MDKEEKQKAIFNTSAQTVAKGISILISLLTTAMLTHYLKPEVYGDYILIGSVILLLDALADLGTRIIGIREVSKNKRSAVVFGNIFLLRRSLSLGAIILGLVFALVFGGFKQMQGLIIFSLGLVFLTSLAGDLEIFFHSRLRLAEKSGVETLFNFLFLIFLFFFLPPHRSLFIVFSALYLARLISLLLGFLICRQSQFLRLPIKWQLSGIKKLFSMALPMGFYLLLFTSYDKAIDSLMIKLFRSSEEVGWYGLAYKIYANLILPAYFFVSSIFPLMAKQKKSWQKIYSWGIIILLLGALFTIPLVYVFSPWFIAILAGREFLISVIVIRILLFALVFSFVNHLNGFLIISWGNQWQLLIFGVIALLFNLVSNVLFIPRYGMLAAAWVTVFTEAIICFLTSGFLIIKNSKKRDLR